MFFVLDGHFKYKRPILEFVIMVLAFYLPRARYLPGRAKVLFFYFQTVPGLPDIKILTFFETRRLSWQFWSFYNDTATKISVTQNFCPDTKNLENLSQYDNYKKNRPYEPYQRSHNFAYCATIVSK